MADTTKMRRSQNVDDQRAAYYTLMTLLRNPLRSQWYGGSEYGGRYQEQPFPENMGQQRTYPVTDLPQGPLSEQAGLGDLVSGGYRR